MAKRTVSEKIISVLLIAHVIVMGFSGFLNAYAEDSGAESCSSKVVIGIFHFLAINKD